MKKYWIFFQTFWQNGLAYPLSFLLWRLRQMLSTLMSLTIWNVVFTQQSEAFGYDRAQMISYVFVVSLLQGAILASSLHGLAGEVYSGSISQLLIKPIAVFKYLAASEVADKIKNVVLILAEMSIFYLIFQPSLSFPSLPIFGLFLIWVILGIVLHFYIEILFGTLGFWSPQVWATKFLFFVMIDVTAGKLFPLDVLPQSLQTVLNLTPFPYLAYVQTQLFLGRLQPIQLIQYSIGLVTWTVLLAVLAIITWRRGIKSYSAAGQ